MVNLQQYETEQQLIARLGMEYFKLSQEPSIYVPPTLWIEWEMTKRCNLRCKHCYQSDELSNASSEVSLEDNVKILQQLVDFLRKWNIFGQFNIGGGEPFVQEWFPDFLEKVHEHREVCDFAVLSNGTVFKEHHVKQLKRLNCHSVQISFDGTEDIHNSIRGPNAFARAVEGIKLLQKHGVRTMVSFTAHRQNYKSFPEVAEFARKLGVNWIWSDRVLPFGSRGGDQLTSQMMSPKEVREYFEMMYQKRYKFRRKWFSKTVVMMHRALQFLPRHKHGNTGAPIYQCPSGSSFLTILPSGHLVTCSRMPIIIGNLLEQNFEDLYQNSLLLQRLRDHNQVPKGCEGCNFKFSCNGGLRCLSYAYHKNPFIADPQCFEIHQELPPPCGG